MTTKLSTDVSPDAWGFVLSHLRQIERMCNYFGNRYPGPNNLEFRHDVLLRIAEKHSSLRLDGAKDRRALISTWIGWQVRAVRSAWMRDLRRVKREVSADAPASNTQDGPNLLALLPDQSRHGDTAYSLEASETRTVVEALFARADGTQRRAMLILLLETSNATALDRWGMSIQRARGVVRGLASRARKIEMEAHQEA